MLALMEKYNLELRHKGKRKPIHWCVQRVTGRKFACFFSQEEAVNWAVKVLSQGNV